MSETTAPRAGASVPPPRENLVRALSDPPVLERQAGQEMPTMVVDFARFNEWTTIDSVFEGTFLERLAPGSMDKTLSEQRDQMRVLFNHGQDPSIGNKVLGPISDMTTSARSARGVVPLLDTSYNRDLIPGLDAGLYGASFRFQVMREDFVSKPKRSGYNPMGLPERTITEAKVREWGPVTFPAYSGATAGLRSMTDEFLFARFVDDPDKLLELLAAYKERRDAEPLLRVDLSGSPSCNPDHPDNHRAEPEPSEAATPSEPEPSAATTRSHTGLFWFVPDPKLKGATI